MGLMIFYPCFYIFFKCQYYIFYVRYNIIQYNFEDLLDFTKLSSRDIISLERASFMTLYFIIY